MSKCESSILAYLPEELVILTIDPHIQAAVGNFKSDNIHSARLAINIMEKFREDSGALSTLVDLLKIILTHTCSFVYPVCFFKE